MKGEVGFGLFAAWVIVLVLFLHSLHDPVPHTAAHRAPHYLPCGTPYAQDYEDAPGYDDVYEAEHDLCNVRTYPYCHALPLAWDRRLDDNYFDNWNRLGCSRDLVPEAGCVEYMPPAEWTRGAYTYTENNTGCIAP